MTWQGIIVGLCLLVHLCIANSNYKPVKMCPSGQYGSQCSETCPRVCDGACTMAYGYCFACRDTSKWGELCEKACLVGGCQLCDIADGSCMACEGNLTLDVDGTCRDSYGNKVDIRMSKAVYDEGSTGTKVNHKWAAVAMVGGVMVILAVIVNMAHGQGKRGDSPSQNESVLAQRDSSVSSLKGDLMDRTI